MELKLALLRVGMINSIILLWLTILSMEYIDKATIFKNLICFSGNKEDIDDETGLINCEVGLKKILSRKKKRSYYSNGITKL